MTGSQQSLLRTRWAAVGAAVAVALGAGGIGLVDATIDSGDKPVTIAVNSERPLDTRFDVGLTGKFVTNTPRDLQVTGAIPVDDGTGSTTTKTVVPTGASAVLVNVTVVLPSHNGHISLRPADATGTPTGSNVNFLPGQVVPNAATVDLSPDGKIELWLVTSSATGDAHIIVDIVGYTIDHHHDDRYFPKAESPFTAVSSPTNNQFNSATILASVTLTAPVAGDVLLNYSVIVGDTAGARANCNVSTGSTVTSGAGQTVTDVSNVRATLSSSRVIAVGVGTTTFNLVCASVLGGLMYAYAPTVTALFIPDIA